MINSINQSLEQVIVELDSIIKDNHAKGIELYSLSKFVEAERHAQKIQEIEKLKTQIQEVKTRLGKLLSTDKVAIEDKEPQLGNLPHEKLPKGLRTPDSEFRFPILLALEKLGGSGHINDVIANVATLMEEKLNQYDLGPLKSTPNFPRWRNTAQWERDTMVKLGLLKKGSPKSTWEMSDQGRRLLEAYEENKQEPKIDKVPEDMPTNLRYIIEVYEHMKFQNKTFESACVRVGAKNGHINPTTIREVCTDFLGVSKDEFVAMLDREDAIANLAINKFPGQKTSIRKRLGSH